MPRSDTFDHFHLPKREVAAPTRASKRKLVESQLLHEDGGVHYGQRFAQTLARLKERRSGRAELEASRVAEARPKMSVAHEPPELKPDEAPRADERSSRRGRRGARPAGGDIGAPIGALPVPRMPPPDADPSHPTTLWQELALQAAPTQVLIRRAVDDGWAALRQAVGLPRQVAKVLSQRLFGPRFA